MNLSIICITTYYWLLPAKFVANGSGGEPAKNGADPEDAGCKINTFNHENQCLRHGLKRVWIYKLGYM